MATNEAGKLMLADRLETRRLVLRQATPRDITSVVRGLNNLAVSRWLGRAPYPYAPCHARAWFALLAWRRSEGRDLSFVITTRGQPGVVVGGIGCHNVNEPSPIVGYWLAEQHWGRGYISEALASVLAEMRQLNPEARPHALVRPANRASIAVLKRAGFRRQPGTCYVESRSLGRNVATIRFLAGSR